MGKNQYPIIIFTFAILSSCGPASDDQGSADVSLELLHDIDNPYIVYEIGESPETVSVTNQELFRYGLRDFREIEPMELFNSSYQIENTSILTSWHCVNSDSEFQGRVDKTYLTYTDAAITEYTFINCAHAWNGLTLDGTIKETIYYDFAVDESIGFGSDYEWTKYEFKLLAKATDTSRDFEWGLNLTSDLYEISATTSPTVRNGEKLATTSGHVYYGKFQSWFKLETVEDLYMELDPSDLNGWGVLNGSGKEELSGLGNNVFTIEYSEDAVSYGFNGDLREQYIPSILAIPAIYSLFPMYDI